MHHLNQRLIHPEVSLPCAPAQERRKEMTKTVSKLSEDGKVAIRNVRRDALKQVNLYRFSGCCCMACTPCLAERCSFGEWL